MQVKINRIGELILAGDADYSNWREIQALLEQRRKLSETERDRRVEMQQTMTVEQATMLVSRLVDIIRRNVSDRKELFAISQEIKTLMEYDSRSTVVNPIQDPTVSQVPQPISDASDLSETTQTLPE